MRGKKRQTRINILQDVRKGYSTSKSTGSYAHIVKGPFREQTERLEIKNMMGEANESIEGLEDKVAETS